MTNRVLALVVVVLMVCSSPVLAADHVAWLAKVEGFFATERAKTPVGEIPFAMDMVKEADGSVHGRTWADKQSYFDFKFYLDEKGELFFHETGALPGGLVQSHILEVAKTEGDTITFESKKSPGLLVATVTADGKQLHVVSVVRGKPHANLQMMRVAAPHASSFAILAGEALDGRKMVVGTPAMNPARAVAIPWFPPDAATMPPRMAARSSDSNLLVAPRALNEPVT